MNDKTETFYDINPFNFGYEDEDEIINNMNNNLKKIIKKNKDNTIYDIGCGCGRNLIFCLKYSDNVYGVDSSRRSLNYTKEFLKNDKLKLILANNLSLPFEDEVADLVISDGVIHHTGDTLKSFCECVRILKKNGFLYLAVYKKWRYYPILYHSLGLFFRMLNKFYLGKIFIENVFVRIHFLLYKLFKNKDLRIHETRNIFYDYFITPIATFQSKKTVLNWIKKENCTLDVYDKTKGNCHIFVIKKNE